MIKKKMIVIGGGISGLCVAALLGKDGFEVTLLEKNKNLGGRMGVWKHKGFVFDTGPSWYLMPEVMENFFQKFNKKPSDYYLLKKLSPSYRAYFQDNDYIDIESNIKKAKRIFDTFEENGGQKLEKYLAQSKELYDTAMSQYLYVNNYSFKTFLNLNTLSNAFKFKFWESMQSLVDKHFTSDRAKKILLYNLVFLGGSPKDTPALYSLLAHVDFNLGVFYPMDGMYKLVEAVAQLCADNNVKLITNCEVKKVQVNSKRINRVITTKGEFEADCVINTSDYWHFENEVLDSTYQTYNKDYWSRKKVAPSAYLIYLGVNKKIKNLLHHNLFFSNDWDLHFREIFNDPKWPTDPSFYVCAPSKTDASVAPKGMENLFILVPIAPGLKDSASVREKYYKKVIKSLEKFTGEDISDMVVVKKISSVNDYKNSFNSYKGTAFGLAHTLFQTSFLRPNIKSKKLDNLYYAGQYVHPGIGVPSVMVSAEVAAKEVYEKYSRS